MDVIAALCAVFILLMYCVYKGIFLFYPLFAGLIIFIAIAARHGFKSGELMGMVLRSSRKSLMIINILILIGAITAVWRASGTVAYVVYYGIKLMNPNYFVVYAFILSCIVSVLLGSSFGTVGTIGTILIVMVKGGNMNINMVSGAIIAGAYFGDRISPMSSSANLVAAVTDTELYKNVKNMFKTTVVPFVFTLAIYTVLSLKNPLHLGENRISTEIMNAFNLNVIVILPAVVILLLAAFRVDVKLSMFISIVCGAVIAVLVQKVAIPDILRYIVSGYEMSGQTLLGGIIKGGGVISMLKSALIILVAFALSGVFEGAALLKDIEAWFEKLSSKIGIFATMIITSLVTSSFGCSQTLALMLAYQLMKKVYDSSGKDKYEMAIDIEDTAIVLSVMIPWNISAAVPAATLAVDSGFVGYAIFLYILPLFSLLSKRFRFLRLEFGK
ncbi:MAG: Na+/H+ antiporter NhaC family protein [Caulobacteraceae bacterium]